MKTVTVLLILTLRNSKEILLMTFCSIELLRIILCRKSDPDIQYEWRWRPKRGMSSSRQRVGMSGTESVRPIDTLKLEVGIHVHRTVTI